MNSSSSARCRICQQALRICRCAVVHGGMALAILGGHDHDHRDDRQPGEPVGRFRVEVDQQQLAVVHRRQQRQLQNARLAERSDPAKNTFGLASRTTAGIRLSGDRHGDGAFELAVLIAAVADLRRASLGKNVGIRPQTRLGRAHRRDADVVPAALLDPYNRPDLKALEG